MGCATRADYATAQKQIQRLRAFVLDWEFAERVAVQLRSRAGQ
jgi:hypothetical protein